MSVRCISQVLDRSVHAGTELLMLLVLADYSDDDGNSYPAVASLARKCRLKPRRANYILAALQDSDELKVLKNEGPKGTNRYRIMLASLGAKALHSSAPLHSAAPLHSSAPTPALQCAKPLHSSADEPSLNRQEPSCSKSMPDGFDVFYEAYPKKVGRLVAIKAFKSVKAGAVLKSILAHIERRRNSDDWSKDGGKYIPHPASYLNGRRWEDEDGAVISAAKKPWEGAR